MTTATVAQGSMPLSEHLREARKRAVRAAVALAVGAVIGYLLSDQILDILRTPVAAIAESRQASLNYDSVTGAFDLRLKIALFAGVVLSSPVWLYQLFAFLTPGLTRREKRYTFGFLFAALPLFAAGCVAGFAMFPHMVELLTGFASEEDSTILQASYYFDFVMKIVVATGAAFVLPVFVVMLNFLGVISATTIARTWRVSVVAIVAFSAMVTPAADVLSMFLIAVPMTMLFAVACLIAHLHDRAAGRRLDRTAAEPVAA
ncbi:twin-arginine translocase subunit TatC [Microbacterium betulae]|uniref:Sec-independent protein translocase protein TatC n=1 Tax=Microbacterium betulae TaxID=2981139 RepID=A0AA97I4T0_9MICO|nr:twin-arginine translocase subunit TatC [Microbacterium sp. AB]WOF22921.1 twin-arginine translocase subunit TatC [Microbacterium sp. AB]